MRRSNSVVPLHYSTQWCNRLPKWHPGIDFKINWQISSLFKTTLINGGVRTDGATAHNNCLASSVSARRPYFFVVPPQWLSSSFFLQCCSGLWRIESKRLIKYTNSWLPSPSSISPKGNLQYVKWFTELLNIEQLVSKKNCYNCSIIDNEHQVALL